MAPCLRWNNYTSNALLKQVYLVFIFVFYLIFNLFGCFFRQFFFKKISDWNADHFFGGDRTQKSPRGEGWGGVF
ncbi:hypothetical protein CEP70_12895 [Providencia stuartii]|nr:hypothetical protein CEP70_12895 [Providencia stuartii]